MYTQCNAAISRAADSIDHAATASPMQYSTTPQQQQYQVGIGELESVQETLSHLNSEMSYSNNGCSSGSGCSSYLGSPSYETQRVTSLMQRSFSSHSLHKTTNKNNGVHHQPFSALFAELLDSHDAPVRRVYSTGDLHTTNGMQHYHQSDIPLSSESSMIIEGMSRASPYSPEEKKMRIERYRSKRNQRNFNKKIKKLLQAVSDRIDYGCKIASSKYACRKTLADSRPRIRGRFARNDESVMNRPVQWSHIGAGEEEDEEDENWTNFFNSLVPANLAQEPHCSSSFGVFY